MTAIINAELIMRDHFIEDAVIFFEDGIITGYGEMRNTPIPEGCEIIDAKGEYVGPVLWTSTPTPAVITDCGSIPFPQQSSTWITAPLHYSPPPIPV